VEWGRGSLHAEVAFLGAHEDGAWYTRRRTTDGATDPHGTRRERGRGVIGGRPRARVLALATRCEPRSFGRAMGGPGHACEGTGR